MNEDGQKVYGLTSFPEWDGNIYPLAFTIAYEMYGNYQYWPLFVNGNDLSYSMGWDDDGIFKRIFDLLFKANQMGLVDPDSVTQTYTDYMAKFASERVLAYWAWGGTGNIYKVVPFMNMKTVNFTAPWYLGNSVGRAGLWVGKKTNEAVIERTLEFINYCIDLDNAWYLWNGPQGEAWDLNEDGIPYRTELWDELADESVELSVGGNPRMEELVNVFGFWRFVNPRVSYAKYGGVGIGGGGWALRPGIDKDSVQASYEKLMIDQFNVTWDGPDLTATQLVNYIGLFAPARYASPVLPDAVKEFNASRMPSVYGNFWEMIFAENQAQYDALWADASTKMREMWQNVGITEEEL